MIPQLVSTIIPVHNRGALLREAVASVLAQTYRPIEIIVVDDGSTDDTPGVGSELAATHADVLRLVKQANGGPGVAREAGRDVARGEFIQYLDSDDLLLPRKFELQVAALRANPDCGVAYCATHFRRPDGQEEAGAWKGTGRDHAMMFPGFLNDRWWDTVTPLYRRSTCDQAGPWTTLRLEEDWEYDCRVAALGTRLARCPQFLGVTRDHGTPRLSTASAYDARQLHNRAAARALILEHARRAGITVQDEPMQRFARSLFLLARQCGAAGLAEDSRRLFDLARVAAGAGRARGWDFRIYHGMAACIGWGSLGKLACWLDDRRAPRKPAPCS